MGIFALCDCNSRAEGERQSQHHGDAKARALLMLSCAQAEPMDMDQGATFDTTALNGTSSPAEGTSISPYGTRRSVL